MELEERKIPSGWWYVVGALFAVAGIAGFVVLLVSNTNPDLRIVLPGSHQLELEKGSHTLF